MHDRFWTDAEKKRLIVVTDFHEMADIALVVLGRMVEEDRRIYQVCGPISTGGLGTVEANMARFWKAVEIASKSGLLVFNQLPFQEAMMRVATARAEVGYCTDILDIFYKKVFESGHIYGGLFFPDWETSVGAKWERKILTHFGIAVTEFPASWLIEAEKVAE